MKAELHNPYVQERFSLLLEVYLRLTGPHAQQLAKQLDFNKRLAAISDHRKCSKTHFPVKEVPKNRDAMLQELLQSVPLQLPVQLPLLPTIRCKEVIPSKCKVLDSAKKPLWLVFEHENEHAGKLPH